MADFPDVNVWVALSTTEHAGHEAAKRYFEELSDSDIMFGWTSAMGLVRITSRKHSFGVPLATADAWANLNRWLEMDGVGLVREPTGLREPLDGWVSAGLSTPSNWTDLYLAAFAVGHGLRMVTFDRGFTSLPGLDLLLLEA